jgi:hypothetical protein
MSLSPPTPPLPQVDTAFAAYIVRQDDLNDQQKEICLAMFLQFRSLFLNWLHDGQPVFVKQLLLTKLMIPLSKLMEALRNFRLQGSAKKLIVKHVLIGCIHTVYREDEFSSSDAQVIGDLIDMAWYFNTQVLSLNKTKIQKAWNQVRTCSCWSTDPVYDDEVETRNRSRSRNRHKSTLPKAVRHHNNEVQRLMRTTQAAQQAAPQITLEEPTAPRRLCRETLRWQESKTETIPASSTVCDIDIGSIPIPISPAVIQRLMQDAAQDVKPGSEQHVRMLEVAHSHVVIAWGELLRICRDPNMPVDLQSAFATTLKLFSLNRQLLDTRIADLYLRLHVSALQKHKSRLQGSLLQINNNMTTEREDEIGPAPRQVSFAPTVRVVDTVAEIECVAPIHGMEAEAEETLNTEGLVGDTLNLPMPEKEKEDSACGDDVVDTVLFCQTPSVVHSAIPCPLVMCTDLDNPQDVQRALNFMKSLDDEHVGVELSFETTSSTPEDDSDDDDDDPPTTTTTRNLHITHTR